MMDTSKLPGQFDPWNNVLGMLGLFEREDLAPGCSWAYVNAVTGNLSLQFQEPNANVQYFYDLRGRLSAVKTECSIDTCTYDGDSDRIVSLSRSENSRDAVAVVRFTYEQVGTSSTFRVRTVTDASGTQTFIYHGAIAGRGRTDLVDVQGQTWTYVYDAGTSQLLEVHSPSPNGERPVATFHYDGQAMSVG